MVRKELNSSEEEGEKDDTGLSMLDILTLPEDQQQIINWMTRQRAVSLADVVAQMGQDEAVARTMLDTLMGKGFVQEIPGEGELHYRTKMAFKRRRQLPSNIWQALE
jgi:hypothetical protein